MFHTLRFRLVVTLVLVVVAAVGIMAFFGTMVTTRMFTRYEEHGGMMRHQRFEMILAQHYAHNRSWADVQFQVERMGQIIRHCTREHVDWAFRYGGDEFTVILPEAESDEAAQVADRIREGFEDSKLHGLTVSIGVISYDGSKDMETLIHDVDKAMYTAKRGGRNRVHVAHQ